jgi:biopolymer transport protein ExbB/TolQ
MIDFIQWGVGLAEGVLVSYSLASVAIMIERAITLRRTRREEEVEYRRLLEAGKDVTRLRSLSAAGDSPVSHTCRAGLAALPTTEERLKEAIGQEITLQTALLQRNFSHLATIASTAPYIGLFGTVLGILEAFRKIAASGETGAAIVAGGISEALITTAIGLAVAVPAVIAYNQLTTQANALSLQVETHSLNLASRLADAQSVEVIVS